MEKKYQVTFHFLTLKRFIILLIALFSGLIAFAVSEDEIEHLKNDLLNSTDSRRIEILKTLSEHYCDIDNDLALIYANQYLQISRQYKSKKDEGHAFYLLGVIFYYEIEYRKAFKYHLQAVSIFKAENSNLELAVNYFKTAANLLYLKVFDSARIYTDSAYHIFVKDKYNDQLPGTWIQYGKIYNQSSNYDSAIRVLEVVLNEPGLNVAIQTWALYWLGNTYYKNGNFVKAEEIIQRAIGNYQKVDDKHGQIGSLQMLGEIYLMKGNYADAYKIFFQCYENRDYVKGGVGKMHFYGQHYLNMGNVFFYSGNYQKAIEYYDSALMTGIKYNFNTIKAKAHDWMGHTFQHLSDYENSILHLNKALEIYTSDKDLFGTANIYNRIGEDYSMQQQTDKAIELYLKALKINSEVSNIFGIATNKYNLAESYQKKGDYAKTRQLLQEGFPLAEQSGVDELVMNYYHGFVMICEITGRHGESHDYINKYLTLSEKINQSNIRNLTDLLIKYYEDGLKNEKKMFENEIRLKNLDAEKATFRLHQMVYIVVIVLALSLVVILLYINKYITNRKLEKIIGERTKTLLENEQKLIETNKTQDKLYSIIAHDLKSPFNSLLGFANLLQEEYDETDEAERRKYIDIMRTSAEEVFFLLENLLEWTRNSLDVIQYKPIRFDLYRTTNQSIVLIEKNATLKNITIQNFIPKNSFVFADENMVRTIFRNLISNAIKFTNPGGAINIGCKQVGEHIECTVADTGIGISPDNIEKLFKVDTTVRKKGTANERGTGLGLALCKEFIVKNGGTITVESEVNMGSKFVFTLPAK